MKADSANIAPALPHAAFIEPERCASGELLDTLTILLTNRRCPWRCVYCDLWKQALDHSVPRGAIPAQIRFALQHNANSGERAQLKLYNAGSFFDRAAIPRDDFPAIADLVASFERVIVECHPALIGDSAASFSNLLRERGPAQLEVAMGLEIADDTILARLNKRMTLATFTRAAEALRSRQIAMRAFVMVQPPHVRATEAVAAAVRSAAFAFEHGATVVSLIPARFGTDEMRRLAASGEFSPPALSTLEQAVDAAVALGRGRVFADLWNLSLFSTCERCFGARKARLQHINHTQTVPPRVLCGCLPQLT